jgi:N-methylhydantoinase A
LIVPLPPSGADAEGVPREARRLARQASRRYQHQGFELVVPWPSGAADAAGAQAAIGAFHRRHERLYTFAQEDTPVEHASRVSSASPSIMQVDTRAG